MRRTLYQRLESRRRELEDQVVVYALTGRTPPEKLVMAFADARKAVDAARRGETPSPARRGRVGRWLGQTAAG